ncbi:hypothetical protein B0J13DRAFT_482978 [Dactylonectria estremocensis]|uniref:Ipa protein n=1 Tax=Dactylonectria estremocensis TaxID=1079267 RepID=A0A9P9E290_9HYPO|nr:hypothetical protein B0J13DRAFT_482978 [Dactylonectria estremocensis]
MSEPQNQDAVKELHDDLARKYRRHAAAVTEIWRSLDKRQRTRCVKAGVADGVMLKHPLDASLGNIYKIIPEWNLRDITEPGSDFLLELLKHRATKTLPQQYQTGVNGGPGDYEHIDTMMRTRNLRHAQPFKDCYTFFMADENYGASFELTSHREESLAAFAPAIASRECVPQSTGELILSRQINLLQTLNIAIEDILEEGSKTRNQQERSKKSDKAAVEAMSNLSIQASSRKMALPDLLAAAQSQRDSFQEFLSLLSTEPVVFAHAANVCFFTRPELIPDEKGRRLPVHTDRHISAAVFDAVHMAVKSAAIWTYMCRLFDLLETTTSNKAHRVVVLQEISNICQLEYTRAQSLFKRHIQSGAGEKWFKRASIGYDKAGNARVTMKGNPEELTRKDAQLHYALRLCQPETTSSKAVDWMTKLSDLYKAHPLEREKLQDREVDSLSDLAVIIGFIQDATPVISIPSASRKKGQVFVSRSQDLEAELNQLKTQIDLRDFAAPIDNLLEPGMTESTLKAIDQFVVEKAGIKLGFLYDDLVEECLAQLQSQFEQASNKVEKSSQTDWSQSTLSSQPLEARVEQRKTKEKTRALHSSALEITAQAEASQSEPAAPSQTFKVSSSTAEVFSTLFDKSKSRGSVAWSAFEAAMAELKFSVMPKFGSVYTFLPPDSMAAKKSFTIHRPHQSRIEGYMVLIFARRLKRVYGWGERTFVAE